MRVVLQRVTRGQVSVAGEVVGQVGVGYVALVGITHSDTIAIVAAIAQKTAHLRVFDDDDGKMNRSILEVGGGVLVVSQFTLYADARKGRRPSYTDAAHPEHAEPLVTAYVAQLQACGIAHVQTGRFGAMMHVEIDNDGPVTIILDSSEMVGS